MKAAWCLYLCLTLLLLASCQKEKDGPKEIQLLQNSEISQPNKFWFYTTNSNAASTEFSFSPEKFTTPGFSLKIKGLTQTNTHNFWYQTLFSPDIPANSRLVLKAKVRTENLQGGGIFLDIRGEKINPTPSLVFSRNTLANRVVTNSDFQEISVVLEDYQPVDRLLVYLLMSPFTTGTVYFDDITLTAIPK